MFQYIKIDAHLYKFEFVDGFDLLGRVSSDDLHIIIKNDIPASRKAETALHEIIHAIANERLIPLKEKEVDQLAAGLYGVIINNPEIFGKHYPEYFEEG